MLELFAEGQVYEVLLVTRSNVTPVGVVRKGGRLLFKLFGGRSAEDIRGHPFAAIQITNDAELLASLGLNLPVELDFGGMDGYRWIKGLPGFYGRVSFREDVHEDELGKSRVLKCSFSPLGTIEGKKGLRPFSRADCLLIEMAVDLTRLEVAVDRKRREAAKKLWARIVENFGLYEHFGGKSPVAEIIIERTEALMREFGFTNQKESL